MDADTVMRPASETPQDVWAGWQREHADVMARALGPHRILLEAAVRFVAIIAAQPILVGCGSSPARELPCKIDHLTRRRRGLGAGSGSGITASA
jgi:hypothetical protein